MNDYYSLLARYGVSTPELAYAGIAAPTDTTDPEYNAMLEKYQVDRAEYDRWLAEYKRRKSSWDMYGPDYQGELLGKPTYTYGYDYTDSTAAAPGAPTAPVAPAMPTAPAASVVGEGGNYSGGNNDPLGGREPGMGLGYNPGNIGWSMDQATQYARENPIGTTVGMLAMPAATIARLGYAGITRGTPSIDQASIDNENTRRENAARDRAEAEGTTSFSDLSPTDQASISNAADPIGALADALGMSGSGGYGGGESSTGSAAGTNGSTGNDTDHGDGSSFKSGGLVGLHNKYAGGGLAGGQNLSPELEAFIRADAQANGIENPTTSFQGGQAYGFAPSAPAPAPAPQAPAPQEAEMIYAAEMEAARKEHKEAQAQLNDYLKQALTQRSEGPSKAEMYFQLAAAFAAPTRTGSIGESLGEASKVLGAHQKDIRQSEAANRAAQMQIGLEMAKNRAAGAKDDMTNLRQLTVEEMKARRLANTPQSEIGKAAMDAGMRPGTPEYSKHVSGLITENQGLKTSADSLRKDAAQLALEREQRAKVQAGKLTPPELKLKEETEDTIAAAASALTALDKALKLNPQTFTGSLGDMAQKYALGVVDPSHPKVKATEEQENLLANQALSSLKTLVGGNPTEGERKVIMDLQGIASKSLPVREGIIKGAIQATQNRLARNQKRLADIQSGAYRQTSPEVTTEGVQ